MKAAQAIRVAIVDDQPLFASGLAMLIEAQGDMDCVGIATDGLQALTLAGALHPHVMLMDLRMPKMNGLVATERILSSEVNGHELPRIIVLTTIHKDEAVLQALKSGASAFLTKDVTPAILLSTIRTAHFGDAVSAQSLELVTTLENSLPKKQVDALSDLSQRERSVFHLVASGLSNAEISKNLYLSDATTKSHVRAILAKLGLKSRIQVVIFAYENRLPSPE